MDKKKKRYFLAHLCISAIVIFIISLLCLFIWFPYPFIMIDGTWFAILLLASVDTVLGPFITLLVVNSKKLRKEIYSDLSVIILIQFIALSFGLYKIFQERIVALVHLNGAFHLVPHKKISDHNQKNLDFLIKYKGYYIAMADRYSLNDITEIKNTDLLYWIDNYKNLERNEIIKSPMAYDSLPKVIRNKYSNKFVFKILVGKSRNAVIILDDEMKILDLLLLKST